MAHVVIDEDAYENYNYYGNPKVIKKEDYSRLDEFTYARLGLTPERVKLELLGMEDELIDRPRVEQYPDSFYEQMINMAAARSEKEFDIVIRPRVNDEPLDFNTAEANSYMYLRTYERPIIQVDDLRIMFNNRSAYVYPDEWLKVTHRYGQLEIQPNFMFGTDSNFVFQSLNMFETSVSSGLLDSYNYNSNFAPQMIGCRYIAGMLPQPEGNVGINRDIFIQPDLIAYIAKIAAIEVLERWGRMAIGAGIAGYGISVDGINTNIQSTQSAENTASTADIKLMQTDMKDLRNALTSYYGLNIGVLA